MAIDQMHHTTGHDVDSTPAYAAALRDAITYAEFGDQDTFGVELPDASEREQAWNVLRLEDEGHWTVVRAPEGENTDAARSIPFTADTIGTAAAAMRAHDTAHPRRSLDALFNPAGHRPWPTFIR